MTFGEFIAQKRKSKGLLCKDIARALGVSTVYVCDIEKGRKNAFKMDKLETLAVVFNLSREEQSIMFDLVGKQRNIVSPDLLEYIMDRGYVRDVLRIARDNKASESEWQEVIKILNGDTDK